FTIPLSDFRTFKCGPNSNSNTNIINVKTNSSRHLSVSASPSQQHPDTGATAPIVTIRPAASGSSGPTSTTFANGGQHQQPVLLASIGAKSGRNNPNYGISSNNNGQNRRDGTGVELLASTTPSPPSCPASFAPTTATTTMATLIYAETTPVAPIVAAAAAAQVSDKRQDKSSLIPSYHRSVTGRQSLLVQTSTQQHRAEQQSGTANIFQPQQTPAPPRTVESSAPASTVSSCYDTTAAIFRDRSIEETEAAHDLLSLSQSLPPLTAPCVVTILHPTGSAASTEPLPLVGSTSPPHHPSALTNGAQNHHHQHHHSQQHNAPGSQGDIISIVEAASAANYQCPPGSGPISMIIPCYELATTMSNAAHSDGESATTIKTISPPPTSGPLTPPTSEHSSDTECSGSAISPGTSCSSASSVFSFVHSSSSSISSKFSPSRSSNCTPPAVPEAANAPPTGRRVSRRPHQPPSTSSSVTSVIVNGSTLAAESSPVTRKHKSSTPSTSGAPVAKVPALSSAKAAAPTPGQKMSSSKAAELYTYDDLISSDGRSKNRKKASKDTAQVQAVAGTVSPNSSKTGPSASAAPKADGADQSTGDCDSSGESATASNGTSNGKGKYKCPECGKQYATSSNLSRHKQTHRSLDSQSAKKCVTCGKAYDDDPNGPGPGEGDNQPVSMIGGRKIYHSSQDIDRDEYAMRMANGRQNYHNDDSCSTTTIDVVTADPGDDDDEEDIDIITT
uniref:C2H2-type domain-containing protein n=1 Tax=Anopheles christyi TaxID=43041 RepID=A0A182K7X6_9DIPT